MTAVWDYDVMHAMYDKLIAALYGHGSILDVAMMEYDVVVWFCRAKHFYFCVPG